MNGAGQKLTRKALKSISAGCCSCGSKTADLFLMHLSLRGGDTISILLCHKCSSQITVRGLIEMVAGKISENQAACYQ